MNTPQNPTGKVLDEEDLGFIAELCRAHDRFAITDEIYEHITIATVLWRAAKGWRSVRWW